MAKNVKSLAEFDSIQVDPSSKTKLIVLFFFDSFDEHSKRMELQVDFWSAKENYRDRVLFIKCNTESSDNDISKKYNVKAIPTFLFIKDTEQFAQPVTGFDARRKTIEAVIDGFLNDKK